MPKTKQPLEKERERASVARAAPIIELASKRIPAFAADSSGKEIEEFMLRNGTGDPQADRLLRRFIHYSVTLLRGPKSA